MGHHSCCNKQKVRRGLWSPEEDEKLVNYISTYGHGCWSSVPRLAGLQRCGKSCRLRWINYLRPDLKRGSFSPQEETLVIELHRMLGNRWAQIAKHLPGRTDNEVKNYWNSCIKKKLVSHGAVGLTLTDNSNLELTNTDYEIFSLNTNPNMMLSGQDSLYLSGPDSTTIGASSVRDSYGHEHLNAINVINYNSDWFNAPGALSAFDLDSIPCSFGYHHQQETAPCDYIQAKFLDGSDPKNTTARLVHPHDASASLMMPKLGDIIDMDGTAMISTTHEVGQNPKLPYFSYSSCSGLCDPHIPMNYMDYMDATMGSSPSTSSGQIHVDPSLPPRWEP